MIPDGVPVLVDFGVTHSLLLSYARAAAQRGELDAEGASERAHAANIYANKKNKRYNRIIHREEPRSQLQVIHRRVLRCVRLRHLEIH